MGNALGNVLGFTIVIGLAIVSMFYVSAGIIAFAIIVYGVWLSVWAIDLLTRPSRKALLVEFPTAYELDVHRTYHIYIMFPGAAQALSAMLNLFRLAGFGWAVVAFWINSFWVGGILIAYFFVVGRACLRYDPGRYLAGAAKAGNPVACQELNVLRDVAKRRTMSLESPSESHVGE